ncbi:MAG: hypothetical protein Q4C91_16115 [Eubacteriales bacterium]|nr:hypothetical protein [Eubacteriales bacterium]
MDKKTKRILMSVIGVVVCGISVGFFKRATFGVDPFQSLMSGLDAVLPISFGTLYVIANVCLLMFSVINDRHRIGIATVVNLLFLGYIADFSHKFLLDVFPELGIVGRAVMLIIGIVAMCLASAFYFTADLGVSTYDAVSLIITEKWHPASFKVCRIVSDLICVVLGVVLFLLSGQSLSALGEIVGVGTIITAFFMGPLIEYFNVHVAQPFLNK